MGVVLVNCGDYFLTTPTDANHRKYNVCDNIMYSSLTEIDKTEEDPAGIHTTYSSEY